MRGPFFHHRSRACPSARCDVAGCDLSRTRDLLAAQQDTLTRGDQELSQRDLDLVRRDQELADLRRHSATLEARIAEMALRELQQQEQVSALRAEIETTSRDSARQQGQIAAVQAEIDMTSRDSARHRHESEQYLAPVGSDPRLDHMATRDPVWVRGASPASGRQDDPADSGETVLNPVSHFARHTSARTIGMSVGDIPSNDAVLSSSLSLIMPVRWTLRPDQPEVLPPNLNLRTQDRRV